MSVTNESMTIEKSDMTFDEVINYSSLYPSVLDQEAAETVLSILGSEDDGSTVSITNDINTRKRHISCLSSNSNFQNEKKQKKRSALGSVRDLGEAKGGTHFRAAATFPLRWVGHPSGPRRGAACTP